MSETINDGGPAFPVETTSTPYSPGMSLRDWFAGQALAGMLSGPDSPPAETWEEMVQHISATAYDYADAMIAARSKGGAQ